MRKQKGEDPPWSWWIVKGKPLQARRGTRMRVVPAIVYTGSILALPPPDKEERETPPSTVSYQTNLSLLSLVSLFAIGKSLLRAQHL